MILDAAEQALALAAFFYLPGWAWSWTLRPATRIDAAACAVALGVPLVLLPAIVLAECGFLTLAALAGWAATVTVVGWWRGRHRATDAARGLLALWVLLALLFAWPQRGEWILGGWDPGVNINQGLLVARTGGVDQPPDSVRAAALREAPGAFARNVSSFVEVFPGVPADPATGALRPYFYRGTPTLVAVIDLLAGHTAALRVNAVPGVLMLLALAGLLARLSAGADPAARRATLAAGLLVAAAQPVWVAHLANPASEMLEALLVACCGYLLMQPRSRASSLVLALVLATAALNRVSFVFLQALLLVILVLSEAPEDDRAEVTLRHVAIAASLAAALAWYTWITPESLIKLRHLQPAMHLLAGGAVAVTLAVDAPLLRRKYGASPWLRTVLLLLPAALIAAETARHEAWREFIRNVPAWWADAGPAAASLAALGLAAAAWRTRAAPWLAWLALALFIAWVRRHAVELYPWAGKRWLPWSPILLAAGSALLVAAASRRFGARGRWLAAACVVAAMAAHAPRSLAAWRSAEYSGSDAAVRRLASSLQPDDLVVADHFLWGTPLALAEGLRVLQAEPLLAGRGDAAAAERFLAGQHYAGRRIVLVTSTRRALDGWPAAFHAARPLGDTIDLSVRELVQHRSNRAYATRIRTMRLQAWTWEPPAS